MLKGHRACIDLEKNVLRIQGREVSFLSEHELPEKAKDSRDLVDTIEESGSTAGATSPPSGPGQSNSNQRSRNVTPVSFPGGGRVLGSAPAGAGGGSTRPQNSGHLESHIRILMDLGATREQAITTLDAAGGNVDVAASLLF